MEEREIVKGVLERIFSNGTFPNPIPSRMNVCGGSDSIRGEVIFGMAQKYGGGNIGENLEGAYNVNLDYFVQVAISSEKT